MRYKQMGHRRSYTLRVPQLEGGVNAADHPTQIENDELVSAQNVRWANGVLKKRQAVRAAGLAPFVEVKTDEKGNTPTNVAESISTHPIDVDGVPCTIVHSGAGYGDSTTNGVSSEYVQTVSFDGTIRATYTENNAWSVGNAAFAPCDKQQYGCSFLMFKGGNVYKPDDKKGAMVRLDDEALYAPLVMVNGKGTTGTQDAAFGAASDGVMYEGFNLLTRRFRARFTTQGGSGAACYKMPVTLAAGTKVTVEFIAQNGVYTWNGKVGETVDNDGQKIVAKESGEVYVYPAPSKSLVADNLTITATALSTKLSRMEGGTTLACWFGGTQNKLGGTRLFLAGFEKNKAMLMWSDVNNPLYFPENNYMYVGDLSQGITALEKQGDMLVIFKEREIYCTTYVQGELDAGAVANGTNADVTVSQAHFPLTQLSPYIGCDVPRSLVMCRDRLVWICADGRVYTLVEGSPYSERNVREIGQKIYPLMKQHGPAERKRASAMDHNGCYTVLIDRTMYSFDYSDSGFASLTSYSSGERAGRRLAWFVHRLDAFESGAVLRVVSDGCDRALLFHMPQTRSSTYLFCRTLYRFEEADSDSYAKVTSGQSGALITTVTDHPITAAFTTKTYDLGDQSVYKRVDALYLSAEGESLCLTFNADGVESDTVHRIKATGGGGQLVLPRVKRCRTFSMTLTTDGAFELLGLHLQYTPFGKVR